jgi:hypothetical protein
MQEPIQAKLIFTPKIIITAEHAAAVLGIPLEKASQIISRPDTAEVLKKAMNDAVQETLMRVLFQMARIPHETVPTRVDCVIQLPELPVARALNTD